jgi:hypothetical protein
MTLTSERAWCLFGSMFRPIAPAPPTSRRALVGLIAVGSVFFPTAATSAPRRPPSAAPRAAYRSSAPNAATAFTSEKGKFRILVNGQEMGQEEFEINPRADGWVAHGTSQIHTAQGMEHVSGTLELRSDGTPVRYQWSTQGAKKASADIAFKGPTATIELHVEGSGPFTQQFTFKSPQIAVLDNNLYHQYAVLARLYDWNKKGAQTFSVLVPQDMTPGDVNVESLGKQDVDGKKLDELRVKSEDLELDLYLDGQRLVRIVAPSSNAKIIRE